MEEELEHWKEKYGEDSAVKDQEIAVLKDNRDEINKQYAELKKTVSLQLYIILLHV